MYKRQEYGTDDDDELILRALVPGEGLEKMRSSGPVKTTYSYLSSPELQEVSKLMKLSQSPVTQISTEDLHISLKR